MCVWDTLTIRFPILLWKTMVILETNQKQLNPQSDSRLGDTHGGPQKQQVETPENRLPTTIVAWK